MNALLLLVLVVSAYTIAFRFYGKFLSRTFELDEKNTTPAHALNDGVDFIPAKNWWVLFGHHFSSICGAGPIVGPVLACAYWGWGVSIIWIVVGAIWMGAVSDFSSLVMSVKSKGVSVAQISGYEISDRVKLFFSIFLWISLILVIAVFSIFAGKTFIAEPNAVLPSFGLIPTAIFIGWLLYQKKMGDGWATLIGLGLLVALLLGGGQFPLKMQSFFGLEPQVLWIFILLVYCFVASILPVNVLLQPRDYLASFILFAMIGIGLLSIVIVRPQIEAPAFIAWTPTEWSKAGPLWPMLFVTIACGAISGFHSLVSSGTTCKQISSETHCCRIGYGGMLVESTVGVLVLIAVSAGLQQGQLTSLLKGPGPIGAFSHGYGALSESLLGTYGKSFAILALNAFILTTLDSATRITRYMTTDVFGVKNKYVATFIVVVASGALALSGKWNLLWPAFGTANQLIAGITLMVASCWLLHRGKNYFFTLIPALLMLVTTVVAFSMQCIGAATRVNEVTGNYQPDWAIVAVTAFLIAIALMIIFETFKVLKFSTKKVNPT